MKRAQGSQAFFASFAVAAAFLMLPAVSSAATNATASTSQVLPPGGSGCPSLVVTSVTPYIYDSGLHSFDIVVPDTSYVAIGGSVGGSVVPFRYMTRSITPDGQLRIHTDINTTAVGSGLPVSVTMLSARPGAPVCATTVTFTVQGSGVSTPTPVSNPGTGGGVPATSGSGSAPSNGASGSTGSPATPAGTTTGTATGSGSTSSTSTYTTPGFMSDTCSRSGAYQLWFILIAIYVLLTAFAALSEPPLAQKSPAIPVALILIPLIVLVGFWYFAPMCRAANWVPIVLLIVAIAGLLMAFRDKRQSMLPVLFTATPPAPVKPAAVAPVAKPAMASGQSAKPATPSQPIQMPAAKPAEQKSGEQKK